MHFWQINGETLFSGRLDRYFRWAAWAIVAVFLACLYGLHCSYLTFVGRATGLEHLSLRIFLGSVGAIGVLGGIPLSKIMWLYWREYDSGSKRNKRLWYSVMTFVPLFGSAVYYFVVYRHRNGTHK